MDNHKNLRIISFLGTLVSIGFDKNFIMNILTKLIESIGLDDKDKIEYYQNFVDSLLIK